MLDFRALHSRFCVAVALGLAFQALVTLPVQSAADDATDVQRIAGSGAFGFADGAARSASFSTPSDIAQGKDGTIYVSDESAERIRVLTSDGNVRTVAGSGNLGGLGMSVVGGYQDGLADQARFNHPLGVAIGPDGALYIADSGNGCIRKLHDGQVSTVIGTPGTSAPKDGRIAIARLVSPQALAFDRRGRLWIADYGVGLRRLDPDGTLTTVTLHSNSDVAITSISISPDADDPIIFATTARIVFIYHLTSGADSSIDNVLPAESSNRPFGKPNRIVAIGHGQALFTDGQSHNVRYLRLPMPPFLNSVFTRILAGGDNERGMINAGYADGSPAEARFYSPRGILAVNGQITIVDSGNRMVRRMKLPAIRLPETGLSAEYHYDAQHYEIAYVGPSVTFWDSMGDDSICAIIEKRVDASKLVHRPTRCHTVRIDGPTVQQIFDYVTNYIAFQTVDLVVIPVDPGSCTYPAFRSAVQQLLTHLHSGTRVVFVWQHNFFTFSDDESLIKRDSATQLQLFPDDKYPQVLANIGYVTNALSGLPISAYDSYLDFLSYEKQPIHTPLYDSTDTHFISRGNSFMGEHVSDYLLNTVINK